MGFFKKGGDYYMGKFVLWVSLSVMLGFAIVLLVPFDSITAGTCPPPMTSTQVAIGTGADRNGDGTVCVNAAGKHVDNNKRTHAKKKAAKKK
jgi:hypothetical protein